MDGTKLGGPSQCEVLRHHAPLFALVVLYYLAAVVVRGVTGINPIRQPVFEVLVDALTIGAALVVGTVVPFILVFLLSRIAIRLSGKTEGTSTWADYRRTLAWDRLVSLFFVWVLLHLVMVQFVGFKGAIPEVHPFSWDATLASLDRALHLGHDPWAVLQPMLGWPWITYSLDRVYVAWFVVNMIFFHWMGWRRRDALRLRFFLGYFLTWMLLGNVLAAVFSSAGPVYFESVVGEPGTFGPLLAYLQDVNQSSELIALNIQEYLWSGYTGQLPVRVEGIAAMPSLHVAIPVLFTLVAYSVRPWLGWVMGSYAFLILLGSVHLSWHYAVDGYASILLVPIIWAAVGWGASRYCVERGEREEG